MNGLLSESEIRAIDESIRQDPDGYFAELDIRPSNTSIEKLEERLRADFGDTIAKKAVNAPHVRLLGIRGLYDGLYQNLINVSAEEIKAGILPLHAERGRIYYIKFAGSHVLVKPYQGTQEKDIARVASEMQVGPRVYGPGAELVEDYLGEEELPQNHPFKIGEEAGKVLRKLHDANIIYGDSFAWHFRYDRKNKKLKLIDFGLSFFCDGEAPIDEKYLWRVILLIDGPMTFNELFKITSDPEKAKKYTTIPPNELKERELESMINQLVSGFRFPIQYGGFKLFSRSKFQELLEKGIKEGYDFECKTITSELK